MSFLDVGHLWTLRILRLYIALIWIFKALKTLFIFLPLKRKFFFLLFYNNHFSVLPSWYLNLKSIYLVILTKCEHKETSLTNEKKTLITVMCACVPYIQDSFVTKYEIQENRFLSNCRKIDTPYCRVVMGLHSIPYLEQTSHLPPLFSRKWSQWTPVLFILSDAGTEHDYLSRFPEARERRSFLSVCVESPASSTFLLNLLCTEHMHWQQPCQSDQKKYPVSPFHCLFIYPINLI